MTPVNFAYWLQGFFEISDSNTLTPEQVKMIRAHLNLVFFHAIDPETLKDKSELEKLKYQKIHDGAKSGDIVSPDEFKELIKKSKPTEFDDLIRKSKPTEFDDLIRKSKPTETRSSIILQDDEPKSFFYDDSRIMYNC